MLITKTKPDKYTSTAFCDALPCGLLNNFVLPSKILPQAWRTFPRKRLYQSIVLHAFKFLKTMILIITSIRTSYLTFNVRVINGRETWPLNLIEERTHRVSTRILAFILLTWTIWRAPTNASKWRLGFNSAFKGLTTGGWKISIMGSMNCDIQHILYNNQIKRYGEGWECNTQEERRTAYVPLFNRRILRVQL
jgi:hypothetical protein